MKVLAILLLLIPLALAATEEPVTVELPTMPGVPVQAQRVGNVTVLGDLNVMGSLRTKVVESKNVTVEGTLIVSEEIKAKSAKSALLVTAVLETNKLRSPSGTVVINGDLAITEQLNVPTVNAASFLVNDVNQWALVNHEDFEDEQLEGWSFLQTESCAGDAFLSGKAGALEKTFTNLPAHSQVRVTGRVHFLDSWSGETVFLKVDDQFAWADSHRSHEHAGAFNVCGGAHADQKLSAPADVTMRHTGNSVKVSFGSNLPAGAEGSFGVDDIALFVR